MPDITRTGALIGAFLLTPLVLTGQVPPPQQPRRPVPIRLIHAPAVKTESTRVAARIVDGACDTTVTMVFRNDGPGLGEKILLLPLPKGATADRLEMEVGGKRVAGEILDKQKARGIYESIVAKRRDPGLLEYVDHGVLRLRVFPIPPRGKQTVHVRFGRL